MRPCLMDALDQEIWFSQRQRCKHKPSHEVKGELVPGPGNLCWQYECPRLGCPSNQLYMALRTRQ